MNWSAIIPRKIVAECSARHIQSVLEDAQSTIARLTAERQELVEALERIASGRYSTVQLQRCLPQDAAVEAARAALAKVRP